MAVAGAMTRSMLRSRRRSRSCASSTARPVTSRSTRSGANRCTPTPGPIRSSRPSMRRRRRRRAAGATRRRARHHPRAASTAPLAMCEAMSSSRRAPHCSAPWSIRCAPIRLWRASTPRRACHQFGFTDDGIHDPNEALQDTVHEWEGSEAAAEGRACQGCHMPAERERDGVCAPVIACLASTIPRCSPAPSR